MTDALAAEGLHTFYGKSHILHGVGLSVAEGTITTLLGRNGAGKTTTLRSLVGLTPPREGRIVIFGQETTRWPPFRIAGLGVGYVPEGRRIFANLTVEENLLTGAFTRSGNRAAIRQDLEKVYQYFPRLKERRKSQAGYTSGGEQQMTALGRALMAKPGMILLDEPSMGLAPQIVEEIFEIVRDLNEKEKVSFLLAEQNTNVALRHADGDHR